jgi:hypothetical protein
MTSSGGPGEMLFPVVVLALPAGLPARQAGAHQEDHRDHGVDRGVRENREQATPTLTAMATCTAKAATAPSHTMAGRPLVDRTSDANIVLSGSSPGKTTGKTATRTLTTDRALERTSMSTSGRGTNPLRSVSTADAAKIFPHSGPKRSRASARIPVDPFEEGLGSDDPGGQAGAVGDVGDAGEAEHLGVLAR